jgi:hypothetical protein
MTIPASLAADLRTFQANVVAAAPLQGATPLQVAKLVAQAATVLSAVDAALQTSGTPLQAPAPSGHPVTAITAVRSLAAAALDQTALSDLRGYLGRAVFNLAQAPV